MPRLAVSNTRRYQDILIADFSGGLKDSPRLNKEFELLQNMYIRSDGYLVGRGQLVTTAQNLGTYDSNKPHGLWNVNSTIGFNWIAATDSNWSGVLLTAQSVPPQTHIKTIQTYAEGSRPALIQGIDKNGQSAVFFSGFDGSSNSVFQYSNGTLANLTSSAPLLTNALMLGFRDNILFSGGGTAKSGFGSSVVYSNPGNPADVPAENLTYVTGPGGGIPQDFMVINDTPVIILSNGIASLTGGLPQGFLPVERVPFNDTLMARTLSSSGTKSYIMGNHGLYEIEYGISELSPNVRGWWNVLGTGASILPPSFGRGGLSANGLLYGAILTNSTIGSTFTDALGTSYDNSILVYDLRWHSWYLFTLPNFAPLFIAPGGPDLIWGGSPGGTLTSFAVLGKDTTNNTTTLAFLQLTDGDSARYQDLPVTSTGTLAAAVDYPTRIRTSQLPADDPYTQKHAGEIFLEGHTSRANVTVTLLATTVDNQTPTQINQWTSVSLPTVLPVPGQQTPGLRYIIDIQGQGDLVLKSILLTYQKIRTAITDQIGFSSDSVLGGGVLVVPWTLTDWGTNNLVL